MNKTKKVIILIIAILIIIAGIIIYNINKNEIEKQENIVESYEHEDETGLTGLIDNEQYYYDKQEEYYNISIEYENLILQYADEKFTEEQKNVIKEYDEKISKAIDNVTQRQLSDEYIKVYSEYMKQQFTEEQLEKIDEKKKQMEALEPIVNEYQELITKAQEEKKKENLEILQDGRIKNNRSGIVEDKEYNGIKYTNIQLIYNPTEKETIISMIAENITEEIRGNELVTLNFTGSTECKYIIRIEQIQAKEDFKIEMPIAADLTDTDKLEIIKFDENDYEKIKN